MSNIDDNRLRRLLEELYKDKKYFDKYVETTGTINDPFLYDFDNCKRECSSNKYEYINGVVVSTSGLWPQVF